jgi:hypothetical protein
MGSSPPTSRKAKGTENSKSSLNAPCDRDTC